MAKTYKVEGYKEDNGTTTPQSDRMGGSIIQDYVIDGTTLIVDHTNAIADAG